MADDYFLRQYNIIKGAHVSFIGPAIIECTTRKGEIVPFEVEGKEEIQIRYGLDRTLNVSIDNSKQEIPVVPYRDIAVKFTSSFWSHAWKKLNP